LPAASDITGRRLSGPAGRAIVAAIRLGNRRMRPDFGGHRTARRPDPSQRLLQRVCHSEPAARYGR